MTYLDNSIQVDENGQGPVVIRCNLSKVRGDQVNSWHFQPPMLSGLSPRIMSRNEYQCITFFVHRIGVSRNSYGAYIPQSVHGVGPGWMLNPFSFARYRM